MTTHTHSRTTGACCVGLSFLLGALPPQTMVPVPSGVLLKTGMRSIDVVGQLIEVGVPSGIEILGGSGRSDRDVISPLRDGGTVPISEVIDAFNRSHEDSRATWRDETVVVRPIRDRSWLLDADVSLRSEQVADVEDAIKTVLSIFDENVRPGGIPSPLMPMGPRGPLYRDDMLGPVQIPSGRMTVLAAFNAIVRQLKGHAWVVMTEKQRGDTVVSWVGVLRREGSLVKIAFNDPKRPRL